MFKGFEWRMNRYFSKKTQRNNEICIGTCSLWIIVTFSKDCNFSEELHLYKELHLFKEVHLSESLLLFWNNKLMAIHIYTLFGWLWLFRKVTPSWRVASFQRGALFWTIASLWSNTFAGCIYLLNPQIFHTNVPIVLCDLLPLIEFVVHGPILLAMSYSSFL